MLKIQAGIFYDGNDIAWKRDVGEAKQVLTKKYQLKKSIFNENIC